MLNYSFNGKIVCTLVHRQCHPHEYFSNLADTSCHSFKHNYNLHKRFLNAVDHQATFTRKRLVDRTVAKVQQTL